jgi:hypothetical protein
MAKIKFPATHYISNKCANCPIYLLNADEYLFIAYRCNTGGIPVNRLRSFVPDSTELSFHQHTRANATKGKWHHGCLTCNKPKGQVL